MAGATAQAEEEHLPGPIYAQVVKVIDGDTIAVRARIWLRQEVDTHVRLFGLDTPEKRGRCESERAMAQQAQDFVEQRLAEGWVWLRDVRLDKYGGRVVARVETPAGDDLTQAVIAAKLGRPYDGGTKVKWCG
ncbi:MAG: thermonuclease family protein [Solirubrobacterales bacterium]